SSNVGKVNGETIELADFNKRVNDEEDKEEERTRQRPSTSRTYQIREQLWNQMVAEKIFMTEVDKLGIEFTSKELSAILLSNDPGNPLLQEQPLLNAEGKLDMAKAQEALGNLKKFTGTQKDKVDMRVID